MEEEGGEAGGRHHCILGDVLGTFLFARQMRSVVNTKERIYIWDNLKCFLMISVVLGHFVNQYPDSMIMRSLSIFIYSYHMPLFIFVAGLLQKQWGEDRPFSWRKPIYFIILGYLLKIAIYLIKIGFGQPASFSLFYDTGIPWYMFAMAAYMTIAYAVRRIDARICLPLSVIIALLAGYVNWIGSYFWLSRILVFFPFYYGGYLLESSQVLKFTARKEIRILSVAVILVGLFVSFVYIQDIFSYIRIFTGRNPYAFIRVPNCGMMHRLACYMISVVMGVAWISLMPDKKIPLIEQGGAHTLQIYFWHRLILYVWMYSGFCDAVRNVCKEFWIPVYAGLAVVLTFLLSYSCFGWPLQKIKELLYRW